MKNHWLISIRITLVTLLIFGFIYPLTITGIAMVAGKEDGNMDLIGQSFISDKYFNSRPSAVNYNAAATGGSNKGPSNPEYLAQVEQRISEFLQHNPTVDRRDVPVDLVTASGSGLDPHISVKAAIVQVDRIARSRSIPSELVKKLIDNNTEKPFFGPSRINVLKINKALDQL